jgi:hypothetical protein
VDAVLTIKYGPEIMNVVGDLFKHHLVATLVALAALLGLLFVWVLRKRYKKSSDDVDEDGNADESDPRRRKRRWL